MNVLQTNTSAIHNLCKSHNVKHLYAFGSVLTSQFTTESDIDFLVSFVDVSLENYADNYFGLKFSLEKILKRQVDLLEEQALRNPYLIASINKQRQLIYGG